MAPIITPVFKNADGQAVRIPLEFSFEADAVEITRNADGDLVIRPLPANAQAVMVAALHSYAGGQGAEFAAALQKAKQADVPVAVPAGTGPRPAGR